MELSEEVEKHYKQKFYETVSKALADYVYGPRDSLTGDEYDKRRLKGEKLLKTYFGYGFVYIQPSNPLKAKAEFKRIRKRKMYA